jgi:hypothetical protein
MAGRINSNHLHFGGSISSKSGLLGSKPSQGNTFKKFQRLEKIVRLENAGFSEGAIASMLCVSRHRLCHIKKSPDYLTARIKITHGIIMDQDASLDMIKAQRREMLTQMLPAALQILANEVQSQGITLAERKHKVALAQDILDREGLFAKISKTEIKPVDSFDFERADEASKSIINTIRSIAPAPLGASEHSTATDKANIEFSNSHTLSASDQEAALKHLEEAAATDVQLLKLLPTDGTVN